MCRTIKKIISILGILIASVIVPSWFYYLLPIKTYLKFGFWGTRDYSHESQNFYYFPKFEDIGIPHNLAFYLNFIISYLFILSCFTVILLPLFYFLKRLIKWNNDVVWERKYVKKPMDDWALNLLFISTLIMISVFLLSGLLAK